MTSHIPAQEEQVSFNRIDADDRLRFGKALRLSANCQVSRESSGMGMSDWTRVVCTCGYQGPARFQWQDNQSTLLLADERGHKEGA